MTQKVNNFNKNKIITEIANIINESKIIFISLLIFDTIKIIK